jgi:hypothetical protein
VHATGDLARVRDVRRDDFDADADDDADDDNDDAIASYGTLLESPQRAQVDVLMRDVAARGDATSARGAAMRVVSVDVESLEPV